MHSVNPTRTIRAALRNMLLTAFCVACVTPLYADPPDAVIEFWEQHWTLNADGSTIYTNKQHVRLNNERAYGAFADPRITYNRNTDKLEILTARVKRADGTYVEAPDYAHVDVGPGGSAGWPAFANITQHLVVLSGIEPGCVVELEYTITSPPGTRPYLAADLRLDHRYPVRKHVIEVRKPPGVKLHSTMANLPPGLDAYQSWIDLAGKATATEARGGFMWTFNDLPGVPNEPQSLPWQAHCVRLVFSTAEAGDAWVADRLAQIDAAAIESDLIKKLADEWTKEADDATAKIKVLQKKFAATFNFVSFDVSWQPAALRPAADVMNSSYGLPAEAAAVFLALARSAGLPVQPAMLVNDDVWTDEAAQNALVAAYVVTTKGTDGTEIWHPQKGHVHRDTRWAGHTLLANVGGKIERTALPAWSDPDESRCELRGKIDIDKNGKYTGKLTLRTSGLFVPPNIRKSHDQQRSRAQKLVQRVLPGAQVDKFTVTSLSTDTFEAEIEIKADDELEKTGDAYRFVLAENGLSAADVPLPLSHSQRENTARLTGAFDERIELTVNWPEAWDVDAAFGDVTAVRGDWGRVEQRVTLGDDSATLIRHTRITRRDLPADGLLVLRGPLNTLRSEHARTLLLKP